MPNLTLAKKSLRNMFIILSVNQKFFNIMENLYRDVYKNLLAINTNRIFYLSSKIR